MTQTDRLAASATAPGGEPRQFGRIRAFWARHPVFTDILIALFALVTGSPVSFILSDSADASSLGPVPFGLRAAVTASVIISAIALIWRRKYPIEIFLIAGLSAALSVVAGYSIASVASIVAAYSVAVYRSPKMAWLCVGALSVVASGANIAVGVALGRDAALVVALSAVTIGLLLIGLLWGSNVYGVRRYQRALIDRAEQARVDGEQRAELAAGEERARIAREMHDVVSHSLTVVVALAEGASATKDHARARQATDAIASTARNALTEMRSMLGVLRSDDGTAPLAPTTAESIDDLVAKARDAGYPITLSVSGQSRLVGQPAIAASRIVQEALTNAMRHADATSITVMVNNFADRTELRVENNGLRPSTTPPGYGLRGLRERTDSVGGTLTSGLTTGGTWRLEATIPVATKERDE